MTAITHSLSKQTILLKTVRTKYMPIHSALFFKNKNRRKSKSTKYYVYQRENLLKKI